MQQPSSFESYRAVALARGYVKHIRKFARSVIPLRKTRVREGLGSRAMDWILPWGISDYPGKQRGLAQLLGVQSIETVRSWVKGHRQPPRWALLALARYIEARCLAGLALVAELEAEAGKAKPRRGGQGFTKVDPVTGLDGRPKSGRRKVREL